MIHSIYEKNAGAIEYLSSLEKRYPYAFSFVLACAVTAYLLFSTSSLEVTDRDLTPTEHITFIDMDTIQAPKRVVKRDVSATDGEVSEDTTNVDRATGTSDDANAVDISFFPNIAPPKPVGRLKKRYPKAAKEKGIEARVMVELLISSGGKIRNVSILGVRLSKELPPDIYAQISKEFARDARKILLGAQFTPPVVNGRQVPIKMEMPLKFRLE